MQLRKQNFFNTIWAGLKFIVWWIIVVINMPVLCIVPKGKHSIKYMRFFMSLYMFMSGIKIKINGKISNKRPLLCVCNHISVFEFAVMPVAFGASFFGKKDIETYPVVGWFAKKFGVVFIDRHPLHAMEALNAVQQEINKVKYPMFLFPEGTTTNGYYVKQFKSTLFNIVENTDITVQPIVITYRMKDGSKISDEDMANHIAYFSNNKIDEGPLCKIERTAFGQVFHVMMLGGLLINVYVLPIPNLHGMDRKQIAEYLYNVISKEYRIKNK